jgi:transcriptional regulator with XRE-family HTH domain
MQFMFSGNVADFKHAAMKNLKILRTSSALTQLQFAQETRLSRMPISLAECNQIELRPDEAKVARSVLRKKIHLRITQLQDALATLT